MKAVNFSHGEVTVLVLLAFVMYETTKPILTHDTCF